MRLPDQLYLGRARGLRPGHVVYVWIDALSNYINALGYENGRYHDFENSGPPTSTLWARRSSASTPLSGPPSSWRWTCPSPRRCNGHGWLLLDGGKMSKKGQRGGPLYWPNAMA